MTARCLGLGGSTAPHTQGSRGQSRKDSTHASYRERASATGPCVLALYPCGVPRRSASVPQPGLGTSVLSKPKEVMPWPQVPTVLWTAEGEGSAYLRTCICDAAALMGRRRAQLPWRRKSRGSEVWGRSGQKSWATGRHFCKAGALGPQDTGKPGGGSPPKG